MIQIQINDKWRIRSDEMNLMLEESRVSEKGKKAGEVVWSVSGFYPSFDALLCGLVRKEVIATDAETLNQLGEKLKRIEETISGISKRFDFYFHNKKCNDCKHRKGE